MFPLLRTTVPTSAVAGFTGHPLDVLFDRFLGNDGDVQYAAGRRPVTPLSIWQDENTIYVEAELPGVLEQDIELTVHGDVLKIRALRQPEKGRTYLYDGRTHGRFDRDVVLPEAVDAEHVEATLASGVLRVALAKHPSTRPRKIALKSA